MKQATFETIAGLLKARSGLMVSADKDYLLRSRLEPVARAHGLSGLDALADRLHALPGGTLADRVIEAMTTNESLFFRDRRPFEHLAGAITRMAAARPPGRTLRIWSAAASSGQEAYSIAMVVADLAHILGERRVDILGSDIAAGQIARAREGLYTGFEVQRGLPPAMLDRHFRREGLNWRISGAMRARVTFCVFNLLDDPRPLGCFDIIFCRNVLIYFDAPTKARVLGALRQVIAPDGLLYLGGAETVIGLGDGFVPVADEPGAYAAVPNPAATFPALITAG